MLKIIRASLYKLLKDRPFKIVLIIGGALAVIFSLFYHFLIPELGGGYQSLMTSSSPTSNFGLAVPINLVIFIIGEFNYGTIRNKIIAGNRRFNIYIALFIMGLIYSLTLMTFYVGVSVGLSTILGGFYPEGFVGDPKTIASLIGATIMVYVTLTALSILTATAIRNMGGAITVTVLLMMFAFISGMIANLDVSFDSIGETIKYPVYIQLLNPLFFHSVVSFASLGLGEVKDLLPLNIVSNAIYSAIFLALGIVIFNYRDVK